MLKTMNDINNYKIAAKDGHIGHVKDFLFDDLSWVIRYFVVETGAWLSSRKVLISPIAIEKPNWEEKTFPVCITKEKVRNSPDTDTDKPVSRQHEFEYFDYYDYPYYWGGLGFWGSGMYPYNLHPGYDNSKKDISEPPLKQSKKKPAKNDQVSDPNLRSCTAVTGYHIHAIDGEIGHISAMLVDESTWAVRYIVVNTSNWWGGHKVLISPKWINEINWLDRTVSIDLNQRSIKESPEYNSIEQLNCNF
jgi:hypothetical protein